MNILSTSWKSLQLLISINADRLLFLGVIVVALSVATLVAYP